MPKVNCKQWQGSWSAALVLMAFMTGLGIGNSIFACRGNSILSPLILVVVELE
jgi:hypothetical protein